MLRIRNDLFRIRIQLWIFRVPDPILFKHIWKLLKKHLKFNQKEESTNYLPFSSYNTVLQYTQSRIHRPKMRNKILFTCFFIFCWIRIRIWNNNSGSRSISRQKFRIHADPDSQRIIYSETIFNKVSLKKRPNNNYFNYNN